MIHTHRPRILPTSYLSLVALEGGHGAGVTPQQRARMLALTYAYLWSQLGEAGQQP